LGQAGWILDAVRVHAPSVALHQARLLDGAASLAAGEALDRLLRLSEVPHMRAIRDGAGAEGRLGAHERGRPASLSGHSARDRTEADGGARAVIASIEGGITAPAGFRSAGVACGIKASGNLDLGLIVSDAVASAAAVFTTNKAVAAPVIVSQEHLAATQGH